jgi:hypothetical protein
VRWSRRAAANPGIIGEVTWNGGSHLFLNDLAISAFCAQAIGEFKTSNLLVQLHKVETGA